MSLSILRNPCVFQGKPAGLAGQPTWTDSTKIYIQSPLPVDYASPGTILYTIASPVAIPFGPGQSGMVFVTLSDPGKTGTAQIFIDTDPTIHWKDSTLVQLGMIRVNSPVSGQPFDIQLLDATASADSGWIDISTVAKTSTPTIEVRGLEADGQVALFASDRALPQASDAGTSIAAPWQGSQGTGIIPLLAPGTNVPLTCRFIRAIKTGGVTPTETVVKLVGFAA